MDTPSAALGFGQTHMGRYLMLCVCGTLIAMTTGIPVKKIFPSPRWTAKTPSLVIQGNRLGRLFTEKSEYLWAEGPSGDGPGEEWERTPLAETKHASLSDDGYKTRSPLPEELFPSHSDPFPTIIDTVIESSEMFNEELLSRSSVPFKGPSSLLNTFIFKPSLQSYSYIISPTPTAELSSFVTGSMRVVSASWYGMLDYESPWLEKSDRGALSETPSENFVIVTAISATHIYSHDDWTYSYFTTPSLTVSDSLMTPKLTSEFFSYVNSSITKIIPTSEVTSTSISSYIIKPSVSLMSSLDPDENVNAFNGSFQKSSLHNQYFISESMDFNSITLFPDIPSGSRGTFLPEVSTQTYLHDVFTDMSSNRSLSSELIIESVSRLDLTPSEADINSQKFTSSNNGVYLIGESMLTISFPNNQFSYHSSFTNYSSLSFHSVNDVQTTVTVIGYSDKSSGFSLPTVTVRGTAVGSRPNITTSHTVDKSLKSSVLSEESIFSTEAYLTSDFTETHMTEVPDFTEFTENIPVISLWPLSEDLPFENANSVLSSEFHTPPIIPSPFIETPTTSSYFQHTFRRNASHWPSEVFTSMKSYSVTKTSSRNFEATKSMSSLISSSDIEGDNDTEQLATSMSLFQSELRSSENASHINPISSIFQKPKFSNEITSDYIIPSQISGAFFSYQSSTDEKSDIGSTQFYHPIFTSFSLFNNDNEMSELREPTITIDTEINEIIESQHETTVLNIPQTSIQAKLDSKISTSSNKMRTLKTFYHSETELYNSLTHHITVRSLADSSIHEISLEYNYSTVSEYPQISQLISFSEGAHSVTLSLATDYYTTFVENVSDMNSNLITKSLYTKSVIPSNASKPFDTYLLSSVENISSEEYEINFPLNTPSISNIFSSPKFEDIDLTSSETVTEEDVKNFISSTPTMTEEETTFTTLDALIPSFSYGAKPSDSELFDKSRTYLIPTSSFSQSFWESLNNSYDGVISHELRSSPVHPEIFDTSDILFTSSEEKMLQDSFLTTFRSYGEDLILTSPTFATVLSNFSIVSGSFFNITDFESFLHLHSSSRFKDSSNITQSEYHSGVDTSNVMKTEVDQSSAFVFSEASKTEKHTDSNKSRFELESKFYSLTRSIGFSSHEQVSNIPFSNTSEDSGFKQFSSISKDRIKNDTEMFDTFEQIVSETYNLSGPDLASSELMSTFAILSPSSFMIYQTPTLPYVSTADSGGFLETVLSTSSEYDASKTNIKPVLPTNTFEANSEMKEMPFKSLPDLFPTPSLDPSINIMSYSYPDFIKSTELSDKAVSDMQDVISRSSINLPFVETKELKSSVAEKFSSPSVTKHTLLQSTITDYILKLSPSMTFFGIKDPASIESSQLVPKSSSLGLAIPKNVSSLLSSGYQTSIPTLTAAPSLHITDSKLLSSTSILTDWKVIGKESNSTFRSFGSKTISNKTASIFISSDSIIRTLPATLSSDSKITISKVTPLLLSSDWKAIRSKTAPLLASSAFTDAGLKPTWFNEESTSQDFDNDTLMVSVLAVSSFTGFNNSKNITTGIGISGTTKNEWPYSTVGTWPLPTMDTALFKDNHYWVLSVLEAPMKDLPENFSHTMEIRFANAYSEAFRRRAAKKGSDEPEDMIIVKILSLTNDLLLRQLEIIYVVEKGGSLVPATIASEYLSSLRYEQLREFLGHHAIVKARPYQPDKETEVKPLGSLIPVTAIICGILGGLLLILCCLIIYCRCCRPKPAPSSPASSASGSLQRSLSKYGQHNRKHMFQEMAHHLTTEMATQMKQGSAAHELYYPEKRAPSGRSLPALPIKGSPEDEPSALGYEKSMKILKILENKDAATSPIPGKHSRGMRETDDSPLEKKKQTKPKKRRKSKDSVDQRKEESKSSSLRPVPPLPKPSSKMETSDPQKEKESPDSGTSSRQFSSSPSSDKGGEETASDGSNAELLPPLQDLISRSKSECEAATAETHLHLSRVRQRISDLLDDAFALAGGRKLYGSLRSKKIDPATDIFPRFASLRSQSATEEQISSTKAGDEDRRPISEGGQRILGAITDDGKLITKPPPKLVWEENDEHSLKHIDRPIGELTEARNRHLNFFPFHQQSIRHLPSVSTSSSLPVLDTLQETHQDTVIPSTSAISLLREAASELYLAHSSRINPAVVDQYDEIDVVSALRNGEPVATLIQAIKDELQKFSGSIPGSNIGESHA